MIFKKPSLTELQEQLRQVEATLAEHPYNDANHLEAQRVIEEFKSEGEARISEELSARGLPSVTEVGKVVATGLLSFGKLNRQRTKLEQQISSRSA